MPLETNSGGGKKFLYSSPGKSQVTENVIFPVSTKASNSPRGLSVDLDRVWSIRNVGLNSVGRTVTPEPAGLKHETIGRNAPVGFYSRHGGMSGRTGSPLNGAYPSLLSGPKWSSSGHNFSQTSHFNSKPQTPASRSEKQWNDSNHHRQKQGPGDDVYDF
ncbi:unnamed protein product [Lymnaea stagnalis]|uniref:Uncharacterized protein n=1 Tax=Lymnaea stagnalis TaxID=6523 RepID=A0AAV2HP68_LYMST